MTTGQANYRTTSSGDYVVIGYWWENIYSPSNRVFIDYWEAQFKFKEKQND